MASIRAISQNVNTTLKQNHIFAEASFTNFLSTSFASQFSWKSALAGGFQQRMRKSSICFFIQEHLEHLCFVARVFVYLLLCNIM